MNRVLRGLFIALLFGIVVFTVAACDKSESGEEANKAYTIQYTDDAGTYSLSVKDGMPYSITPLPEKEGYVFLGLYDSKVGGTQYVDEKGASLSVFADKKNMVLFPQFKAKEYTLALDYQGAEVSGSRKYTVSYNEDLPELPKNLTMAHKVFVGWYTEPECGGKQISDQYGNLPLSSTLNDDTFNLSGKSIILYAGFVIETHTVTFYNGNGESEEIKVVYNTPIKEVVPDFRNNGMAPISWSKSQSGEKVFTGKVTEDMVLYVAEWAPILEFDAAGGKEVSPLVARAGTSISLSTPTRKDYTFAGWYTTGGVAFSAEVMPEQSATLVAHWNAQLIFDARGGTDVAAISEAKGTAITLPTTEKADYIFAGWYTEEGDKYEATSMPEDSLRLQAKYYKIEHKKYTLINDTTHYEVRTDTPNKDQCIEFDLTESYEAGVREIKVSASYLSMVKGNASEETPKYNYFNWYSQKTASDAYLLWKNTDKITENDKYIHFEQSTTMELVSPIIYVCPYGYTYRTGDNTLWFYYWNYRKNFWVEVEYPDMTTLY